MKQGEREPTFEETSEGNDDKSVNTRKVYNKYLGDKIVFSRKE